MSIPIETNGFMMCNTITELANMCKVKIDIGLVFTFCLVWKYAQKSLAAFLVIVLCKEKCPKAKSQRRNHLIIVIYSTLLIVCFCLFYFILIVYKQFSIISLIHNPIHIRKINHVMVVYGISEDNLK